MPNWGDELHEGDRGDAVVELQMRLAGFRGTVPDGIYGGGTKLQVQRFQADFMGLTDLSGQADRAVLTALDRLAHDFPMDFNLLKCPCGQCGGFGRGINRGVYVGANHDEAFHRYEYPGLHRMLLWGYRAVRFYARKARGWELTINSGYRCSIDNKNHNRSSTNHMGKAIDIFLVGVPDRAERARRSNLLRGDLVHDANAQIRWLAPNRKALEPADIAPTWVHYDVRTYDPAQYLLDKYFVKTEAALNAAPG